MSWIAFIIDTVTFFKPGSAMTFLRETKFAAMLAKAARAVNQRAGSM
jgi:hypothetical protein